MFRTVIALLAAALASAAAPAQDKAEPAFPPPAAGKTAAPPRTAPKAPVSFGIPGEVEINFLNGSTVRMLLESEKIDIQTPYGQLSVPSRDIRGVEFGLHFPEGVAAKIEQAVKSLGGGDYRQRDQAGKTLLDLAPYSYPALYEASRAGDLEVSRRAKELVKQMQAKHPKKDLKISSEDRLITPTFTIVGKILTPTIKAKAELFGQVELPVARMRTMRSLFGASFDVDVTIDATKYANVGQWMETEFQVDGRSTITITAKGVVDTWPQQNGQYMVGPNGLQERNLGVPRMAGFMAGRKIAGPIQGQMYGGMLVGKIGEDGEPFIIGERYEGSPEAEGKLYLHIGPSPWNSGSTGSYEVKIARKQ